MRRELGFMARSKDEKEDGIVKPYRDGFVRSAILVWLDVKMEKETRCDAPRLHSALCGGRCWSCCCKCSWLCGVACLRDKDVAAAAKSVWFDQIDAFLWPGRSLVEGDVMTLLRAAGTGR
jgi:hypothetical protein